MRLEIATAVRCMFFLDSPNRLLRPRPTALRGLSSPSTCTLADAPNTLMPMLLSLFMVNPFSIVSYDFEQKKQRPSTSMSASCPHSMHVSMIGVSYVSMVCPLIEV